MNTKHKGPHCDGLCEGAAYVAKIRALDVVIEAQDKRIDELETELQYYIGSYDKQKTANEKLLVENETLWTLIGVAKRMREHTRTAFDHLDFDEKLAALKPKENDDE